MKKANANKEYIYNHLYDKKKLVFVQAEALLKEKRKVASRVVFLDLTTESIDDRVTG